jgi:hypothetical protein
MKKIAMIRNGIVENVAIWDGISPWNPTDFELVEVTDQPQVGCGWSYSEGVFSAPKPTENLEESYATE